MSTQIVTAPRVEPGSRSRGIVRLGRGWGKDLVWMAVGVVVLGVVSVGLARWYDSAQADKDRRVLVGARTELAALSQALGRPVTTPDQIAALDAAVNAAESVLSKLTADGGMGPRTFDVVDALTDFGFDTETANVVCATRPEVCGAALADLVPVSKAQDLARALRGPMRWASA